jgi:serine/threonine protein phosphatase 1
LGTLGFRQALTAPVAKALRANGPDISLVFATKRSGSMFNWFRSSSNPILPPGQRAYAVGDVHGRLDLLDELLEAVRVDDAARDPAQTTLVFLGDLIDRGPDSREVINRVRAGVDWARTIALMGNHEAVMLEVLDGHLDSVPGWLKFGGRETLISWGVAPHTLDEGTLDEVMRAAREAVTHEERGWIGRLRSHVRIGDYYFVHAGIRPGIPLGQQVDEDRLWIREEFLESRKKHEAMIVHGHSVMADVQLKANRIGLDTGAYATGRLTALGIEDRKRWLLST